MSLIAERIKSNLAENGQKDFILWEDETISGTDFLLQIEEFEQRIRSSKVHECVAIDLNTSPTALACFIASLSVAKNTAYLDRYWPKEDRDHILQSIGASLIIEEESPITSKNYGTQIVVPPVPKLAPYTLSDCAHAGSKYTCFTSGTTGKPKGCVRSEKTWISSFEVDQEFAKIMPECTIVVLGSFAHSLAMYAATRGLFAGASVRLFLKFDAPRILKQIQSLRNSILIGVPTQLAALTRASVNTSRLARTILSTGSKLSKTQANDIHRAFPNAELIEFYGTSELSYISARTMHSDDAPTCVGQPLKGVNIAIQSDNGTTVKPGELGLIKVQSHMAFDGYISDGTFSPAQEWISVGDTGFLDDDGALHLVGRIDRMFQCSGRNIVPEAIEVALEQIDGILSASAFGLFDKIREHRIVSVIETNGGMTRKFLVNQLKNRIAGYAIPHRFYICENWPKTASGKTNIHRLKDLIMAAELPELS